MLYSQPLECPICHKDMISNPFNGFHSLEYLCYSNDTIECHSNITINSNLKFSVVNFKYKSKFIKVSYHESYINVFFNESMYDLEIYVKDDSTYGKYKPAYHGKQKIDLYSPDILSKLSLIINFS